jgi:electron transfer flavoprotein alpha subunit
MTVRATAFDKAAETGGSGTVENVNVSDASAGLSSYVSSHVTKSARPDLATAKTVVSGGRGKQQLCYIDA